MEKSKDIISLINKLEDKYKENEDLYEKYIIFAKMKEYFLANNYKSFDIVRVLQSNYYDLSLTERKIILNAPSEAHLCKSIIMENTAYIETQNTSQKYNPKYVCIIIQFITKIHPEKVMKFIKNLQNNNCENKLGRRSFHFRLVDEKENDELTGFRHHGVTPFCLNTKIPILISEKIIDLTPKCIWLGGGDIDLKIRIGLDEFITKFKDSEIMFGDVVY